MDTREHIIIFSTDTDECRDSTGRRDRVIRDAARQELEKASIRYTRATGVYRTSEEQAFIAAFSNYDRLQDGLDLIIDIAADAEQESILYSDNERNTYLVYINKEAIEEERWYKGYIDVETSVKYEYLGKLKSVSEAYAKTLTAYTKVGKRYFAAL